MVVLGMHSLDRPMRVGAADPVVRRGPRDADLLGSPGFAVALADQRATRSIAVNDDFEDVVAQIGVGEVPVVVVGLVEKI